MQWTLQATTLCVDSFCGVVLPYNLKKIYALKFSNEVLIQTHAFDVCVNENKTRVHVNINGKPASCDQLKI